jgi:AraC family transcriptional regulator
MDSHSTNLDPQETAALARPHGPTNVMDLAGNPVAGIVRTSRSRAWNGASVHVIENSARTVGPLWVDMSSEVDTLAVVLDSAGGRLETRECRDRPNPAHRPRARQMSLIPAGTRAWGYTESTRWIRCARVSFDSRRLRDILGEDLACGRLDAPRWSFSDERVWQLVALLSTQCGAADSASQLYGDCLTVSLFRHLLSPVPSTRTFGMSGSNLRRVTEYLEANLMEPVRLGDLAAVAGLSQSQLGRSFKASTGTSPHRWLLDARIRAAKRMLLERNVSQAAIALAVGFSEQSHFARVFRQLAGLTPGSWLRGTEMLGQHRALVS